MYNKDLGLNVGVITENKLKWNLARDKGKKYDELKLSFWINKMKDINTAYIYFKICSKYKQYFIEAEFREGLKKERALEIQYELISKRLISKCNMFSDNIFQVNFWMFLGFSKEDSIKKISIIQKKNSSLVDHYKIIKPNQQKYWINRGFTEKNAKLKVKQHQTTFSLEICKNKYGDKKGQIIFDDRQRKWQKTLNAKSKKELDLINQSKSFTKKYKNEEHNEYFNRVSKIITNKYKRELKSKNKYNQEKVDVICEKYNSLSDYKDYILYVYKNTVAHNFLSPNEIYDNFNKFERNSFPLDEIIILLKEFYESKEKLLLGYSYIKRIKQGLLRSSHEIEFYYGLLENNIEFILEKYYKNSNMRCDFYIPDLDLYIEIAGMMKNEKYSDKMTLKNKKFNALIVEPNNIKSVIKKIKDEIYEKNKNKNRHSI